MSGAGREGRTRREEGEQGQYKCDLLTGVSPPKPAFKVKDAQVASPGVAEFMLPEKDCIVLSGAVPTRRLSVVSQNSKIMSARDASRRRRRTKEDTIFGRRREEDRIVDIERVA